MVRTVLFLSVVLWFGLVASPASSADQASTRRYNFVTKKMEFFDGTDWYNFNLGVALGACTNEAEMEYNTVLNLYQYCDGINWIRLIGALTLSGCSPAAKMDYFDDTYKYCNGLVWVDMKGPLVL